MIREQKSDRLQIRFGDRLNLGIFVAHKTVIGLMFRMAREQIQVFRSIIKFYSVNVMNFFTSQNKTIKSFFSNQNMFRNAVSFVRSWMVRLVNMNITSGGNSISFPLFIVRPDINRRAILIATRGTAKFSRSINCSTWLYRKFLVAKSAISDYSFRINTFFRTILSCARIDSSLSAKKEVPATLTI